MFFEFYPKAQIELEEATAYYDSINRKFGNAFVESVEKALNRIDNFPDAWTLMFQNVRRCHIDGFPYGIVYRIQSDHIQVLAIMHLQRKPSYWTDRN